MGINATKQTPSPMAEGTQAKAPLSSLPEPPLVPRRDEESAHKDDVVLGYVTHLAHPLPLSFRTLRVIREMNETFEGAARGKPAHTSQRVTCPRTHSQHQKLGFPPQSIPAAQLCRQLPSPIIIITTTSPFTDRQSPESAPPSTG